MAKFEKQASLDESSTTKLIKPYWQKLFEMPSETWFRDISTGKQYQLCNLTPSKFIDSMEPTEAVTTGGETVFIRFLRKIG